MNTPASPPTDERISDEHLARLVAFYDTVPKLYGDVRSALRELQERRQSGEPTGNIEVELLARECDRAAAHWDTKNKNLDLVDLLARASLAMRAQDAVIKRLPREPRESLPLDSARELYRRICALGPAGDDRYYKLIRDWYEELRGPALDTDGRPLTKAAEQTVCGHLRTDFMHFLEPSAVGVREQRKCCDCGQVITVQTSRQPLNGSLKHE